MSKQSSYVILVNIHNTIAALNEAILEQYYLAFPGGKKKKSVDILQYAKIEDNFSSKESELIQKIYSSNIKEGFYTSHVKPFEGAVKALKEMRANGFDVLLCATPFSQNDGSGTDILKWVYKYFDTPDWVERTLILYDKRRIQADILIDDDPVPDKGYEIKYPQTWKHVVFDRPWNRWIQKTRIKNWLDWKIDMGMDENSSASVTTLPFYRHGSPDSRDIDVYYVFPSMPSARECFVFMSGTSEDRNLIVIDKECGVISESHKGNPDETNNSLFHTYKFHKQDFPLLVTRTIARNIPLKLIAALRNSLGRLTDCELYKSRVKPIVRGIGFQPVMNLLKEIDFTQSGELPVDEWKNIAFQFGQTFGLIEGKEFYTKGEIAESYPTLKPFLYRFPDVSSFAKEMNEFRDKLYQELEGIQIIQDQSRILFYYDPKQGKKWNHLRYQSRGIIIECRHPGGCVVWPFNHFIKLDKPTWSQDGIPNLSSNVLVSEFVTIYLLNDTLQFAGESSFDNDAVRRVKDLSRQYSGLIKLAFQKYTHVLVIGKPKEGEEKLFLVALRSRVTHDLMNREELMKEAAIASLDVL